MNQFKEGYVVLSVDTYNQLQEEIRVLENAIDVRVCHYDAKKLEAVVRSSGLLRIIERKMTADMKAQFELFRSEHMYDSTVYVGELKPVEITSNLTLGTKDDEDTPDNIHSCVDCGEHLYDTEAERCEECAIRHAEEDDN